MLTWGGGNNIIFSSFFDQILGDVSSITRGLHLRSNNFSFFWISVPANVKGLLVTKITGKHDQLYVEWDATSCVDAYTVLYRKTNSDQCWNTTERVRWFWDGVDTSVTLTGLDAYTTYEIVVLSNNSLGYGESNKEGVTDITGRHDITGPTMSLYKVKKYINDFNICYDDKMLTITTSLMMTIMMTMTTIRMTTIATIKFI